MLPMVREAPPRGDGAQNSSSGTDIFCESQFLTSTAVKQVPDTCQHFTGRGRAILFLDRYTVEPCTQQIWSTAWSTAHGDRVESESAVESSLVPMSLSLKNCLEERALRCSAGVPSMHGMY